MLSYLEKQTKLTGNQHRIIFAAILGDMLEFFDYFLIGYVVAFIAGPWKLTFGESAVILLSSGFGAMFGATFYDLYKSRGELSFDNGAAIAVGYGRRAARSGPWYLRSTNDAPQPSAAHALARATAANDPAASACPSTAYGAVRKSAPAAIAAVNGQTPMGEAPAT